MFTDYLFLNILLFFILITKIILIILKLLKKNILEYNLLSKEVIDSLEKFSYLSFQISISLLLIILFNPITDKYLILNYHIKLFLFIYGVLGLIYYIH